MRIQHNISALNSYRQLSGNNSALAKNLEKLSSGYRINRAGDDAAGLAISEKMRAQIKGLEAAQKNANDGISLVQTAEGALTEVHSMLNRMVYIATQSANGTYDDKTSRAALQDEVTSLLDEINRIAEHTNFNGMYLLGGQGAGGTGGTTPTPGGDDTTTATFTTSAATGFSDANLTGVSKEGDVKAQYFANGKAEAKATGAGVEFTTATANTASNEKFSALNGKTLEVEFNSTGAGAATVDGNGNVKVVVDKDSVTDGDDIATAINTALAAISGTSDAEKAWAKMEVAAGTGTYSAPTNNDGTDKFSITMGDKNLDAGAVLVTDAAGKTGVGTIAADGKVTLADTGDIKGTFTAANNGTAFKAAGETTIATAAKAEGTDKTGKSRAAENDTSTEGAAVKGKFTVDLSGITSVAANKKLTIGDKEIDGGTSGLANAAAVNAAIKTAIDGKDVKIGDVTYTAAFDDTTGKATFTQKEDPTGTPAELKAGDIAGAIMNDITPLAEAKVTIDAQPKAAGGNNNGGGTNAGLVNPTVGTPTSITLQVGDTAAQTITVAIQDMHTDTLAITGVDISTQPGASQWIDKIKTAIDTVSSYRGNLGATQNRLEHTINNLGVTTENITAAESRIRDTDMAEEMMAYTKNNILVQAAQAMLAQANTVPQGILQLLQ